MPSNTASSEPTDVRPALDRRRRGHVAAWGCHTELMRRPPPLLAAIVAALAAVACGGDDAGTSSPASEPPATAETTGGSAGDGLFPDVLEVSATQGDDGTWTFAVTISSPYDSPDRYADAWRVLGPDGTELGVRELLHDHAGEQPFTRSLSGIEIAGDVTEVTVQARDQLNGWGGATVVFALR